MIRHYQDGQVVYSDLHELILDKQPVDTGEQFRVLCAITQAIFENLPPANRLVCNQDILDRLAAVVAVVVPIL